MPGTSVAVPRCPDPKPSEALLYSERSILFVESCACFRSIHLLLLLQQARSV